MEDRQETEGPFLFLSPRIARAIYGDALPAWVVETAPVTGHCADRSWSDFFVVADGPR